ncbi:MAG: hypothetical protein KAH01_05170 [Caldisericia bacterium]|nr:hypothetical protein [Caldisericia bacterium]
MKNSKQSIIKNKYFWVAIAFLIVGVILWNFTDSSRQEKPRIDNSLSQTQGKNETDVNIPLNTDENEENILIEKKNYNPIPKENQQKKAKESGRHVTPEKEIVIDLPASSGEVSNEFPSHYKLLKIGDIDDAIRNLNEVKSEIEKKLEQTPNNEEFLKELKYINNEIKKLTVEREKIVNGDF